MEHVKQNILNIDEDPDKGSNPGLFFVFFTFFNFAFHEFPMQRIVHGLDGKNRNNQAYGSGS